MLWRECAVDPECLGIAPETAANLLALFDCERGRVIAECPGKWIRAAHQALDRLETLKPIQRSRLEERLKRIKETALFPGRPGWDGRLSWTDAAAQEHARAPFALVLSREGRDASHWVHVPDDFDVLDPRLAATHEILIPRTAAAMAGAIAPLLCASKQVMFVDPHFSPASQRFIRPLQAWLRVLERGPRTPVRLEYHALWDPKTELGAYQRNLSTNCRFVPADCRLSVIHWSERRGGEKMHARYVITERAAVRFDVGLDDDDGRAGQNVPLTILPYDEHQRWLATFHEDASVFDRHDCILDVYAGGRVEQR